MGSYSAGGSLILTGFDSMGSYSAGDSDMGSIKKLSNVKFIGSIMYLKNCFVWKV
jgi:hypothetical protein